MGKVTFVEETTSGGRSTGRGIDVAEGRLPLRELIRRRVEHEVAESDDRAPGGLAPRTPRQADVAARTERALKEFAGNGFVVLVGERQITDLDEEMDLTSGAEVTFLRLVPLAGG
ncbi:hypothetical protein [Streptomyces avicenniae]|uniref:hypothetical protein n=1 Tax=Streptomyces avicenniae TaxID=500153 RepID=UPI00069A2D6A|nr:hypothetical protein [Streptomyces avicenniae]